MSRDSTVPLKIRSFENEKKRDGIDDEDRYRNEYIDIFIYIHMCTHIQNKYMYIYICIYIATIIYDNISKNIYNLYNLYVTYIRLYDLVPVLDSGPARSKGNPLGLLGCRLSKATKMDHLRAEKKEAELNDRLIRLELCLEISGNLFCFWIDWICLPKAKPSKLKSCADRKTRQHTTTWQLVKTG